MRRGYEFEEKINGLCNYYILRGDHAHKNHPNRTASGSWLEGEPFDYEILTHGVLHCFDAKECAGNRWSLKNAKTNQVINLLGCAKNGAEAYFLVWFKKIQRVIRFDAQLVHDALAQGKKSLTPNDGVPWEWESAI